MAALYQSHCMDVDNGDGDIIKDLPCVKRLNQLQCTRWDVIISLIGQILDSNFVQRWISISDSLHCQVNTE